MSSKIKTPILFNYNGKNLIIMEIIFEKDNSIYFVFPRKKQYVLDSISEKKYYRGKYIKVKRDFINLCKKYKNPKVSFHPGKKAVHINSFSNHVKKDYKIFNAINYRDYLICFLIQIVLPVNYNIFEEYNKINDDSLIINNNENRDISGNKNISLEIIIHSNNIMVTKDILPKANRDFKYMTTYNSGFDFAVTISVSELETSSDDGLLLNINTLQKSIMYKLKPCDDIKKELVINEI